MMSGGGEIESARLFQSCRLQINGINQTVSNDREILSRDKLRP